MVENPEKKKDEKLTILPVEITAVSRNGQQNFDIVAKVKSINGSTLQEVVLKKAEVQPNPEVPAKPEANTAGEEPAAGAGSGPSA